MRSKPRAPLAAVACVSLAALLLFLGILAIVLGFVADDRALLPAGAGAVVAATLLGAVGQICADVARLADRS